MKLVTKILFPEIYNSCYKPSDIKECREALAVAIEEIKDLEKRNEAQAKAILEFNSEVCSLKRKYKQLFKEYIAIQEYLVANTKRKSARIDIIGKVNMYTPRLARPQATPNRIFIPPITVVLEYGDFESQHHSMLKCQDLLTEGSQYIFPFTLIIDPNWPLTGTNDALISQWRQNPGNPFVSIHIRGNQYKAKIAGEWHELGEVTVNTPTTFEVEIRFDTNPNRGLVKITKDGVLLIDYKGATFYEDRELQAIWTAGIYNPSWNQNPPAQDEPRYRRLQIYQGESL